MGVDYLTLGVGNPWTQHWVSQGATYIHGLDGTNEAKRKHLVAAFDMAGTSPMQIITSRVKDDPAYFMVPFKMRHGQPVFHSQYPDASGDDDIDPGPWLTWSDEYETLDWTLWSVRRMTAGLREVAYVFWDEDRVNDFELMIIYSSVPNASSNNPGGSPHHVHLFELKMADMRRKFEHSLDLWQQGWTTEWHGDEPRNVRGHPREGKPVPRKSKEDGARD
jgi:hypothetical protein